MDKQINLKVTVNSPAIRRQEHEGKNYIIAPVVILTEGVHCGSAGRVYHSAEELQKHVMTWNGIPITVGHPKDENDNPIAANSPEAVEQFRIGNLYNAEYANDPPRIIAEMWIDLDMVSKKSPETLADLNAGKLEVSTGMYHESIEESGVWNTEEYDYKAFDYRPEHLAALPGWKGACSWEDGCGAPRINCNEAIKNKDKIKEYAIIKHELSHGQIGRELQNEIDKWDKENLFYVVEEIYDNDFVYSEYDMTGNESKINYFRLGYSKTRDDKISLADQTEKEEVRLKQEWVNANGINRNKENNNGGKMTKEERIAAMIACNKNAFTEDDKPYLEGLSEERLEAFEQSVEQKEEPKPEENPEGNAAPININDFELPEKAKEYIRQQDIRMEKYEQMFVSYEQEKQARKQLVVNQIIENPRNEFTTKELMDMDDATLKNLAKMVQIKVNYGMAQGEKPTSFDPMDGLVVMAEPEPIYQGGEK